MRIAIDLDNTLIDYSALFESLARDAGYVVGEHSFHKAEVRDAVITKDGHDRRWRAFQAEAYGRRIDEAKAFPGALAFVQKARSLGHELFLVSHKTAYSNLDPRVELREAARQWLRSHDFLEPEGFASDAVFFCSTREEKVLCIRNLGCHWVIDDLIEVLEAPELPASMVRFWFTQGQDAVRHDRFIACSHWSELQVYLEVQSTLKIAPGLGLQQALGPSPRRVEPLGQGGNARLKTIVHDDGARRVLKAYRNDGRRRAEREAVCLHWLHAHGFDCVPKAFAWDDTDQYAVQSWIPAKRPSACEQNPALAEACARFVLSMAERSRKSSLPFEHPAADCRFRLDEYRVAIERRLRAVASELSSFGAGRSFFDEKLEPLAQDCIRRFEERAHERGLDLDTEVPESERILSPSDMGPHNVGIDDKGKIYFFDFEYFGWDDPAKLMADCLASVAHDAPDEWRKTFVTTLAAGLPLGHLALRRLEVFREIVAFEWVLIVLNVFEESRRVGVENATLLERLAKAKSLVSKWEITS